MTVILLKSLKTYTYRLTTESDYHYYDDYYDHYYDTCITCSFRLIEFFSVRVNNIVQIIYLKCNL